MTRHRAQSVVRIGVSFEVVLPDDCDNVMIARWAKRMVEQAPETRDLSCEVFAIIVGDMVYLRDEVV